MVSSRNVCDVTVAAMHFSENQTALETSAGFSTDTQCYLGSKTHWSRTRSQHSPGATGHQSTVHPLPCSPTPAPSTAERWEYPLSGTLTHPLAQGMSVCCTGPDMLFLMDVVESVMALERSAVEQVQRLSSTSSLHTGPLFCSFSFSLDLPCSCRHFLLTLLQTKVYFDIINEHKTGYTLDPLWGFIMKSFYWAALLIYAVQWLVQDAHQSPSAPAPARADS